MAHNLQVVMYHYVRDIVGSRYPKIKGMEKKIFEAQLDFFSQNYTVVSMEDVIEAWNTQNGFLPENSLLLTFDDGYIDHFTVVYPLLKEKKMQGSFFIPGKIIAEEKMLDVNKIHYILASADIHKIQQLLIQRLDYYRGMEYRIPSLEDLEQQYKIPNRFDTAETTFVKRVLQTGLEATLRKTIVDDLFMEIVGIDEAIISKELYLNRCQIRHMQNDGMYIGLHGYEHNWLGDLDSHSMMCDIDKSLDIMAEFVDRKCWVLNYPYGSYNQNTISYIEKMGCKLGLATNVKVARIGIDSRYEIPRLDCNDYPPITSEYKYYI